MLAKGSGRARHRVYNRWTMELFLSHLPHIVPAAVGLAFLIRFGIVARRSPPADLSDEELRTWQAGTHGRDRGPGGSSSGEVEAKQA
jgi:hypothetical protein